MMLEEKYLRDVTLPEGLTCRVIFDAMIKTQEFFTSIRERAGVILSSVVQANNFSGIVSNVFTKMLSEVSVYRPYDEQRYPDLIHESINIGLEVKASNKPMKGGEGYNSHRENITL